MKKKNDFFEDVDKYLQETKDKDLKVPGFRKGETCEQHQKRIEKKASLLNICINILYSILPPLWMIGNIIDILLKYSVKDIIYMLLTKFQYNPA